MKTQDWINEQKIQAVQDRKDGKDYWRTDNLYTESDLIELIEAFALGVVSKCTCKIPEPKIKCSENGINAYCCKCAKSL